MADKQEETQPIMHDGEPGNIRAIQRTNARRANRWHGNLRDWSVLEWAGAMCGEAGEAANFAKKILRAEQGLRGNNDGETIGVLREKLAAECADVFLYLCLLCSRYDIDLLSEVVAKFNSTSIKQGFPERLW